MHALRLQHLAPALALALVLPGCQCDDPTFGRTLPPGARIDTFGQAEVSTLDLLWVIDNSSSMIQEQQNLHDNLVSFFTFLDEGEVDYRIGVTTTDALNNAGRLVGTPSIITPVSSDPLRAFQGNLLVGTSGRAQEQGLAAAELALDGRNQGFLRPEAWLFVIFVSDEDDHSFGEIRYFWRIFEQAKGVGNEEKVTLSAIIGPPTDLETGAGGGCASEAGAAAPGDRYAALAEATGGLHGAICDASFATTLEALGALAVGLKRKFFLSETPDPESIEVTVVYPCEGRPAQVGSCEAVEDRCGDPNPALREWRCVPPKGRPEGWVYETETNAIFFVGDSVPGVKSRVEVLYKEPEKVITQ